MSVLPAPRRSRRSLEAELLDTIRELRESRARVAGAADAERRRIERDLHDGCQQRLIALRVKLALAEEFVGSDGPRVADLIREIAADAEAALEELHLLVHGIYPSVLSDHGLSDALRTMARGAPIPVRVVAGAGERYGPAVEAAAYFTCAEAVQNAVKHGGPGTSVQILVHDASEALEFEVRDDGAGFDTGARWGAGLANMRDRVEAVAGRLTVESAPGRGTTVRGRVAAAPPAR
jgi:signal transduction histidine kinase